LNGLRTWAAAAGLALLAIPILVEYVDRPVAKFSNEIFGHFTFVSEFAGTPSFFGPLEILIAAIFVLRRIALYPLAYPDVVLAQCEISLLTTKFLLSPLKLLFGRTWPLYGHPSYLIDGVYGFNFFSAGPQYQTFPSGHAASICALFGVLWTAYPGSRPLYTAGAAAMAIVLIAGNFHFVSDVDAGGLLGASIAAAVIVLWEFITRELQASAE